MILNNLYLCYETREHLYPDPLYECSTYVEKETLTLKEEEFRRKMGYTITDHDDIFSIKCAYQASLKH